MIMTVLQYHKVFRCWLTSIVQYLFAFYFLSAGAVWNGLTGGGVMYDDRIRKPMKESE
jgi:hypothetical protein